MKREAASGDDNVDVQKRIQSTFWSKKDILFIYSDL